eukprot:jgi/Tetstr1/425351/TSEL_015800.t1
MEDASPDHQPVRFMDDDDRELRITYKELKDVRYAALTFLSELRGRPVLLHEDNKEVVYILANLPSPSPLLMTELRNTWYILGTNDISIRARYIKRTANIRADRFSREIDYSDWSFSYATSTTTSTLSGVITPSTASLQWRTCGFRATTLVGAT